jgi:allantoinase
MSDFDMVIRGSLVSADNILEDGWLGIVDGKIAAMGSHSPPAARDQVDARGLWVLPGAVDSRTYIGGWADGCGIGRASRAAAAGGVTTLVDMPYEHAEVIASRAQLDAMVSRIGRDAHVDVAVAGTVNTEHGLDAADALARGGVCAFSIPTFEAERQRFAHHESDLLQAFQGIARFGLACSMHNHARLTASRNARRLLDAGRPGREVLARANLPLIEGLTTRLLCRVGAAAGVRMQAADVWSEQGYALCASYRQAGHWVTIETSLRSLMMSTEDALQQFGGKADDYPLLRPRVEVDALWRRLATDMCTFVSSGYQARSDDGGDGPAPTVDYGPDLLLPALWSGCEARRWWCACCRKSPPNISCWMIARGRLTSARMRTSSCWRQAVRPTSKPRPSAGPIPCMCLGRGGAGNWCMTVATCRASRARVATFGPAPWPAKTTAP